MVIADGEWQWRLVKQTDGVDKWQSLLVASSGGDVDWCWRQLVENGVGDLWFRLVVKISGGE